MSTPSLLNIPYRLKAGTLYSQIPESGAGDFTVSRTTTPTAGQSTRINSQGFIELVANNVPRLDYPVGGAVNGCPALLVEPSAQNIETNSENISVYSIITGVQTLSGQLNTEVAPDGATTGDRALETAITDIHAIFRDRTVVSGTTYTFSIFAKSVNGRNVQINGSNGFAGVSATVDLSNGAILASTGTIAVQNYGGGWYRISLTVTASSTSGRTIIYSASGTSTTFLGDVTKGVALWGAQVETGSVATSYIPTTTGSVTRSADVIRQTNIASLIGQSEGTVYFEVEVTDEARNKWFFTLDSASNSFIQAWIDPSRRVQIQIQNAAAIVMVALVSSTLSVGYHKVAFAYNTATNGCEMFIDGVQNPVASRTVTGAGLPAFNNFTFGSYLSTQSDTLKAHIRAGTLYPTRLPNTGPNSLTTLTT